MIAEDTARLDWMDKQTFKTLPTGGLRAGWIGPSNDDGEPRSIAYSSFRDYVDAMMKTEKKA